MPTMNISLTDELAQLIQNKVSSGMYNNASEVIRDAIRRLESDDTLIYELKMSRIKHALADGIKQAKNNDFVDQSFDEIIAEATTEYDL